ncbi:MAG: hypothetical protein IJO97_08830 [Lachnospiraceae bacterium]|nr:hypothetical protein [Lachnospiraceae bacterium]
MKKFRIILCCLVGIIGFGICMFDSVMKEDDYVYFELQPTEIQMDEIEVQLEAIEAELNTELPEEFIIDKLVTHRTFVPDMWQSVEVYYRSGNGTAVAEPMIISYDGNSSCKLHSLIITEGVEHREKLIAATIGKMCVVIILIILCVFPYRKIYRKLDGL